MNKKIGKSAYIAASLLVSVVAVNPVFAGVPKDELPVPLGQLQSEGNCCGYSPIYWDATRTLSQVTVGGSICYKSDVGSSWHSPDGNVNANAHIIYYYGGTWYAAPWDYMGVGQTCKNADHIGDMPGTYYGWKPTAGETYYHFLSGISRDPSGGSQERTNIVKQVWGEEPGYPPASCEGVAPPVFNKLTAATFFTEGYVANSVSVYGGGKAGLKTDAAGNPYNVIFSWDISNADGVEVKFSDGKDYKTTPDDPIYDGFGILLDEEAGKTITLTVYAANECTDEANRPSKTIAIKVVSQPITPVRSLLLNSK